MAKISYKGYRFPPEIIQRAIWLYYRFTLSFRDVEDLLAERGIIVSYETPWQGCVESRRRGVSQRRFGSLRARDGSVIERARRPDTAESYRRGRCTRGSISRRR
jgi:hypothetical protein